MENLIPEIMLFDMFNDMLLSKGLLTPEEHRKIALEIEKKRPTYS